MDRSLLISSSCLVYNILSILCQTDYCYGICDFLLATALRFSFQSRLRHLCVVSWQRPRELVSISITHEQRKPLHSFSSSRFFYPLPSFIALPVAFLHFSFLFFSVPTTVPFLLWRLWEVEVSVLHIAIHHLTAEYMYIKTALITFHC